MDGKTVDAPARAGPVSGLRVALFALKPLLMLAALLLLPLLLQVSGAIRLQAFGAWRETSDVAFAGPAALAHATAALRAMSPDVPALAAEATQEGHWRFVNRAGETVTVGTADEMARLAELLLPGAKAATPLTLLIPPESLIARRASLATLPASTLLRVVVGADSFAVLGRAHVPADALYIEVRPNVLVSAASEAAVREALWQLNRAVDRASVRILALEVGGPTTLTPVPRAEKGTGRAMIDVIDPASLVPAMGSVRGQTLIVTGRVDRDVLYVQPSSGAERGLRVQDLLAAADSADVDLLILESVSTPRQPGGRNWLWQRVEVKGLEEGLQRARLADLLNAVGGSATRFLASVRRDTPARTQLELTAASGLPRSTQPSVGEMFMDAIGDLTGRVVTVRVQASLRSLVRQRELDRRIVPFVPSLVQLAYGGLLALGLVGFRTARTWWARIWPPERARDYVGAFGYRAARVVRGAVFFFLFLPLASVLAAPVALLGFRRTPAQAA